MSGIISLFFIVFLYLVLVFSDTLDDFEWIMILVLMAVFCWVIWCYVGHIYPLGVWHSWI